MTKHVAKGATVDTTEVTEANVDKLAERFGGQAFTSERNGQRFLLVEGKRGTSRADVGGYVVDHGDGDLEAFRTAEEFGEHYERP